MTVDVAGMPRSPVATTAWRLIFAGIAWWGLVEGMTRGGSWNWPSLYFFSQFSTLLVALTATGSLLIPLWSGGALERGAGVLRGATATYATITLVVFATLLNGSYRNLDSQLMHIAIPVLALLDWLVVGRNQQRVRWFVPLIWLAVPLAYMPFYIHRSNETRPLYNFLNPGSSNFVTWVLVLLAGFLVTGFVLVGIGRLRGALLASRRPVAEIAPAGAG